MADAFDLALWVSSMRRVRSSVDSEVASLAGDMLTASNEAKAARIAADLRRLLPPALTEYAALSAGAAAEWFSDVRDKSAPPGRFTPRPIVPDELEDEARNGIAWALGDLFTDAPTDHGVIVRKLSLVSTKAALSGARLTVEQAVEDDPAEVRFARVPTGSSTCEFCLMLASRGAAYHTADTARGRGQWHGGRCDCVPTPIWDGDPNPPGYDPDDLYERWQAARDARQGKDGR